MCLCPLGLLPGTLRHRLLPIALTCRLSSEVLQEPSLYGASSFLPHLPSALILKTLSRQRLSHLLFLVSGCDTGGAEQQGALPSPCEGTLSLGHNCNMVLMSLPTEEAFPLPQQSLSLLVSLFLWTKNREVSDWNCFALHSQWSEGTGRTLQ